MSVCFSDLPERQKSEPQGHYYHGIFKEDPAIIGRRLPRPKAPLASHSDLKVKLQSLSCIGTVLLSRLPPSGTRFLSAAPLPFPEV
jgi:hypothetical protein